MQNPEAVERPSFDPAEQLELRRQRKRRHRARRARDRRAADLVFGCGVIQRYPYHASLLSRIEIRADSETEIMAVSARGIARLRLHVNLEWAEANRAFLLGVLLHELNHLMLGHTTDPRFREADYPGLMQYAEEASANEYIAEPLFGTPITVERLAKYGIRPHQSTLERYAILVEAMQSHPELQRIAVEGAFEVSPCGNAHRRRGGEAAGIELETLVENLSGGRGAEPGIDWRRALRELVPPRRADRADWRRVNRRFPERIGEVAGRGWESTHDEEPRLLVAIDTSASMDREDLERFADELDVLARRASVRVVECDRRIRRIYDYEVTLPEIVGRGGTDLQPVFAPEFLEEHRPTAVVYFTDGQGPYPEVAPGVPTLWVLASNADSEQFECPWGRRVAM